MIDEDNKEDDPDEDERHPLNNSAHKIPYGKTPPQINV